MFTSKGLFGKIDCPYSNNCVLPKCLFAHPTALAMDSPLPLQAPSSLSSDLLAGKQAVEALTEDGQRKRRKISHEEVVDSPSKTNVKQAVKATSLTSSEKRPISPPPRRRTSVFAPEKQPGAMSHPESSESAVKHVPKAATSAPKPVKLESLNPRLLKHSPATHDIRTKLVKLLHDQLVRLNTELLKEVPSGPSLVLTAQQLITMALDIEEQAAKDRPAIHSSVVKNTIIRYKKMSISDWKSARQAEVDVLSAKSKEAKDVQLDAAAPPPKPIETGLPLHLELSILPKLRTPTESLSAHGYVSVIPSDDSIATAKAGLTAAQGWEVCDRCKARFQVFPGRRESDGHLTSGGQCTHHWGKPYFPSRASTDVKGSKREKRYRCCGQAIGDSAGCTKAESHVFKVTEVKRLAALWNFITTPDNDAADEDMPVCIDGEMGYTVQGLELIRLTATSWPSGSTLLDVLVRPIGEVLDLNSRWSGVTASQLTNAPVLSVVSDTKKIDPKKLKGNSKLHVVESPAAARDLLLMFLTPRTPIIGHGLENDLNATRLIHPTIIDTALIFPHQAGLPFRNALRTIVSLHLRRTIQAGGGMEAGAAATAAGDDAVAAGHDSKEDANAAGDLVRWAVGREWEKMKQVGWTLSYGKLVPPSRITEEFLEDKQVKILSAEKTTAVKRQRVEGDEEDGEVIEE